ncbi:MAG TPA: ABC transporter permease [Candidatus Nanoarchaeia archaeon]|nr:ABC transporter permease [Candidatus Nanoarchaeia archaeon]
MIKDYTVLAIGSLRKRFLRTLLTMIGIFIGIASVVALISLGQGMQAAINQQFASVGTDKILIQGAAAGFGPPGQNAAGTVDKEDLELIRKVPGVDRAAGRLLRSATLEYADDTQVTFAASLPEEVEARDLVIEANNLKTAQGRMLKAGEKGKILVGNNFWTSEEFPKKVELGSKILVNGKSFEVVGLLDKIGAGRDDAIIVNENDLRELLHDKNKYSALIVQTSEKPADVAERILRAMRRDRHQKEGFEDITVQTSEDLIASVNTVLGVVQAVFIGIAAISLLVGGIGIMNTMYTSVLERTHDIGIMKAIGARNSSILWIFLIESGLLGLAGGIIGVLLGAILSKIVELIGQGFVGDVLKASFHWHLIFGALAFSFFVGALSGILPARQAAKLPPVEALRGD